MPAGFLQLPTICMAYIMSCCMLEIVDRLVLLLVIGWHEFSL